jgi:aspartate ammonia-lyase
MTEQPSDQASPGLRTERDSLGEVQVPAEAYYGVHTQRAIANFRVTGLTIGDIPGFPESLASVKRAAAQTNAELGLLDSEKAAAIVAACKEISDGRLHDQFLVDPIQGGAGTSTNMNANEVIANRALEILGRAKGDYTHLDPLAHVNLGQSTNDVYPTAIKLCMVRALRELWRALERLADTFEDKFVDFADVVKMGRTQLQDAVPMTLGQEFATYAVMLREDCDRLAEATRLLLETNLGGTAIGTGINGHRDYSARACAVLAEIVGEPVVRAGDLIEATQDCGAFVQVSGVLKRVAVKLSKTCNDLRLTSSGPAAGLAEINLPPVQAGSSIMPGKVNPVIPEMVNQVAFLVIGHDITITMAAEAGQLQLNAFEPIIAHTLMQSIRYLTASADTLAERCVAGITANREHLREIVSRSPGTVTALAPVIGYDAAARIAKQALATGDRIADIAVTEGLLSRDQVALLLDPARLAGLAAAPAPPASPRTMRSRTPSANRDGVPGVLAEDE